MKGIIAPYLCSLVYMFKKLSYIDLHRSLDQLINLNFYYEKVVAKQQLAMRDQCKITNLEQFVNLFFKYFFG